MLNIPTSALVPPLWSIDVPLSDISEGVSFTPVMLTVKVAVPTASKSSVAVTVYVSLLLDERELITVLLGTKTYAPISMPVLTT